MRRASLAALLLAGCQASPPGGNEAGSAAAAPSAPIVSAPATAPAATAQPKAAPLPATHPWSPTGYALNGTEPFWGGTVAGTRIRYMIPENQFGTLVETSAAYAPDRETYSGTLGGRPFVLTLTAGPCSNGMSDHVYAFTATLEVGGETRRGCADPEAPGP